MTAKTDPAIYGFSAPLPTLDPSDLSPGVRELVVALREAGLFTTDSGDGSNYEAGMGCAMPFPHVFVLTPTGTEDTVVESIRRVLDANPSLVDWPFVVEQLPGDELPGQGLPNTTAVWVRHADYEAMWAAAEAAELRARAEKAEAELAEAQGEVAEIEARVAELEDQVADLQGESFDAERAEFERDERPSR